MAVNFYDVNFNQPGDNSIPAISGYIINDYGYEHRSELDGQISMDYILSKPSATNNIQGAVSMDRKHITVNEKDVVACRLQGGGYIYIEYTSAGPINVNICDNSYNIVQTLTLPFLEDNSNISLVGHFDTNDELDWVTVGYTYRDNQTNEFKVLINTNGFSSTVKDELKPYVYLKYKYPYQVVIQKSLSGTNDFQISRFPSEWFSKKMYGTGEGQSQKYNDVVLRLDPGDLDVWDKSCAFCGEPNISTQPLWYYDGSYSRTNYSYNLSLAMGAYLEQTGYSFGSDICRKLPDGKFYNGVDLSQENIVWNGSTTPYEIEFNGGKLQLYYNNYKFLRLLDNENNVIDSYQFPYPVSGGGSTFVPGNTAYPLYNTVMSCYLAEYNNHYYLIGLYQRHTVYNDDNVAITYDYQREGTHYAILYKFSNEGNQILYDATENEKIVPENPDELTADETSNQTTEPEYINEYGNEIPIPEYNEGEWDDHSTEGIRGSGEGQQTGNNIEGNLDQQPGLPSIPSIPTAVSTGFMKLYNPSDAEILALCNELTGDSVLLDLKKYLGNNPLDFIVGLQVVPGTYSTGANKYKIKYGSFSSNVSMYPITDEFTEIDYGTLDLKEIYGSWEDYNPHTKMSIYLPYIGIKDIDPDRINGTLLTLKYLVDATTGSILASLTSTRKDDKNAGAEILVGQWAGQALYTIPLTNVQHNNAVNSVLSVVGAGVGVGMAIATGGSSALLTAGMIGSVGNAMLSGAKSQKADISMQGGVSGSLAFFTGPDAYIQIEFPIQGRPDNYDHIIGKPSNITTDLAHQPLNNYIEFVNVDVSGIDAPKDEKQMIIDLMIGGVYS